MATSVFQKTDINPKSMPILALSDKLCMTNCTVTSSCTQIPARERDRGVTSTSRASSPGRENHPVTSHKPDPKKTQPNPNENAATSPPWSAHDDPYQRLPPLLLLLFLLCCCPNASTSPADGRCNSYVHRATRRCGRHLPGAARYRCGTRGRLRHRPHQFLQCHAASGDIRRLG
jgi:hypothetical protein